MTDHRNGPTRQGAAVTTEPAGKATCGAGREAALKAEIPTPETTPPTVDTGHSATTPAADILRQAAALMRERAQAVEHFTSPWHVGPWRDEPARGFSIGYTTDHPLAGLVAECADYIPYDGAEHIAGWHPTVALAVADWLNGVADRHRPRQNTSGLPDACPDCVGGLGLDDPGRARSCGCWGLSEPICGTCAQSGSAVRRYPQFWPCRDMDEALAVAVAYLGLSSSAPSEAVAE